MEIAPDALSGLRSAEERLICAQDAHGFLARFFKQFHPEMLYPGGGEFIEKLRAGLRRGVVKGVAATSIRTQRVGDADAVAQVDAVLVAGTAAI